MKTMSKVDAAFLILKESSKKEMTCKEIIVEAIERKIIVTKGKTPEATLRVDICNENRRHQKNGKPIRFVVKPKGLISLNK